MLTRQVPSRFASFTSSGAASWVGIAAFVPAWLAAAGIRAFSFVTPLAPPASYMGPGVAGFMVVGVCYLTYLYARHPSRVTEVGLVHLDEAD